MRAFFALAFVAAMVLTLAVKLRPHARGELAVFGVEVAATMATLTSVSARDASPAPPADAVFVPQVVAVPSLPSAPLPAPETEITIVLAGDTGLNASYQPVYAGFATKHGERLAWTDATHGIARQLDGDVNFANLETVVTDRNDIEPKVTLFTFRTHPDGVRQLARAGLNLFSTANNHAMDFGLEGVRETVKHLDAMGVAYAGVGLDRDAARTPRIVWAKGRAVALAALGIVGNGYASPRATDDRPGHLGYRDERDMADALASLAASKADVRILSVHYGQELEVNTGPADRRRLGEALTMGADLVVGHHHHVVAGIEIVDGKPVFYGLGNFLHWGMQNMSRFDVCRDYGLLARVHLSVAEGAKPALRAIEVVPLTDMHRATRALSGDAARTKLHVLNHLAEQFGDRGVRFKAEADGSGLYCAPGTEARGDDLGRRCRAAHLEAPPPALAQEIRTACARRVVRVVENDDGLEPIFAPVSYDGAALPVETQ